MRILAATVALVAILVLPAAAQRGSAEATTTGSLHVFMFAGKPGAGGKVIAVTQLSARATAEIAEATHADLRIGTRGFVFAVAKAAAEGQAIGETMVTINGRTRTLFTAAADLQAALASAGVVLFTEGQGRAGVVVAMVPAEQARSNVSVSASGATHVTVIVGAEEHSFALVGGGATTATMLVVEPGAATGAAVEAQAQTLVNVLIRIGL